MLPGSWSISFLDAHSLHLPPRTPSLLGMRAYSQLPHLGAQLPYIQGGQRPQWRLDWRSFPLLGSGCYGQRMVANAQTQLPLGRPGFCFPLPNSCFWESRWVIPCPASCAIFQSGRQPTFPQGHTVGCKRLTPVSEQPTLPTSLRAHRIKRF